MNQLECEFKFDGDIARQGGHAAILHWPIADLPVERLTLKQTARS